MYPEPVYGQYPVVNRGVKLSSNAFFPAVALSRDAHNSRYCVRFRKLTDSLPLPLFCHSIRLSNLDAH